jgi:hypothetical protein
MTTELKIKGDETVLLDPFLKDNGAGGDQVYELRDAYGKAWLELVRKSVSLEVRTSDPLIIEEKEALEVKLNHLYLAIAEAEQRGVDLAEAGSPEEINPFNPEDIRVHAKQFSLRLIADMIKDGDIDLQPDFQRNLVWNTLQKSRLIESILLRIPLPMFYFSEAADGRITIVDGLQRLSTIKEFMDNKFALKNLEYLNDSCEGKYYVDDGNKKGIEGKYFRWFNQTQFSVNVIDPSSPPKVKYDIFKRINTGGNPLNNQEIRNCLSGPGLRDTLNAMAALPEFHSATDWSIRSNRMDDHEIALRFILFWIFIKNRGSIDDYNGYMDPSLDVLTEEFAKVPAEQLAEYIAPFSNAMKNAEYLFGRRFAFRKVRPTDLLDGARKQLINKALFVSCSVLLAPYNHEHLRSNYKEGFLVEILAERIEADRQLLDYLSYGTNGRNNLLYVFQAVKEIIQTNIQLP